MTYDVAATCTEADTSTRMTVVCSKLLLMLFSTVLGLSVVLHDFKYTVFCFELASIYIELLIFKTCYLGGRFFKAKACLSDKLTPIS